MVNTRRKERLSATATKEASARSIGVSLYCSISAAILSASCDARSWSTSLPVPIQIPECCLVCIAANLAKQIHGFGETDPGSEQWKRRHPMQGIDTFGVMLVAGVKQCDQGPASVRVIPLFFADASWSLSRRTPGWCLRTCLRRRGRALCYPRHRRDREEALPELAFSLTLAVRQRPVAARIAPSGCSGRVAREWFPACGPAQ